MAMSTEKKLALIQQLDDARAYMEDVVAQIDPAIQIYPLWKIKEILAHLAGWDDAVIEALKAVTQGFTPGTPAALGLDYYNEQTVTTRQSLPYEHIQQEWRASRELLKKAILEFPDELFDAPFVLPWGPTGTITGVVRVFSHHEQEHAEEILQINQQHQ